MQKASLSVLLGVDNVSVDSKDLEHIPAAHCGKFRGLVLQRGLAEIPVNVRLHNRIHCSQIYLVYGFITGSLIRKVVFIVLKNILAAVYNSIVDSRSEHSMSSSV